MDTKTVFKVGDCLIHKPTRQVYKIIGVWKEHINFVNICSNTKWGQNFTWNSFWNDFEYLGPLTETARILYTTNSKAVNNEKND